VAKLKAESGSQAQSLKKSGVLPESRPKLPEKLYGRTFPATNELPDMKGEKEMA
jgi:hypothetical protein